MHDGYENPLRKSFTLHHLIFQLALAVFMVSSWGANLTQVSMAVLFDTTWKTDGFLLPVASIPTMANCEPNMNIALIFFFPRFSNDAKRAARQNGLSTV